MKSRRNFSRASRIALALAPMLAGVAGMPSTSLAQTSAPSQAELDAAIAEALKLEKTLPTPATLVQKPQKSVKRIISADEVDGTNQKNVTAKGRVSIKQGTMEVTADIVTYDKEADLVTVPGKVTMNRDGDVVTGEDLKLKVDEEVGHIEKPSFFFSRNPNRPTQRYEARGSAAKMDFEGEDKERLYSALYTTCRADQNDWYLKVSELALDRGRNVGSAVNGVVEFKGVPILYLPYMTFPLNSDRKSGFLSPTFGSSSSGGLDLAIPYY
ncbi:MAG: LPS-assembly protein LptD, partial [Betaproteobacteria bacterium]|nr:LPS-assembly protein LptD [Betaproteobacteria bacterium]